MLAHVTNKANGARGFQTREGATSFVEPGETALIDLADHPLHRAWEAAGEVRIVPTDPPSTKAEPDEAAPSSRSREKVDRRSRAG